MVVVGFVLGEACTLSSKLDDYTANAGHFDASAGGGATGGGPTGGNGGTGATGGSAAGGSGGTAPTGGSGGGPSGGNGGTVAGGGSGGSGGGLGHVVVCGTTQCETPAGHCCIENDVSKCWDINVACADVDVACDGPEDCPGEKCCATTVAGETTPTKMACSATCAAGQLTVCGSDPSVCASGTSCVSADTFPQYKLCAQPL
jgi:hypothetical protein